MLTGKLLVTLATVLGLSWVAEHVSTRWAGVLAGFPLGTAIALYFIGLEQGAGYAGEAARFTLNGFVAAQVMAGVYAGLAGRVPVALTVVAAVAAFMAASALTRVLDGPLWLHVAVVAGLTVLCARLFRRIPDVAIGRPVRLTWSLLGLRALASAAIILAVTGSAGLLGKDWAGLLSAFPITFFPMLVLIHLGYGAQPVRTLIRYYPAGLGALITHATVVALAYPVWGVNRGTLLALTLATGYVLAYQMFSQRLQGRAD